jgi:Holliday junction resolvase
MGKVTSIYLTDEEIAELKKFCNENQCTQYLALKTAISELLSKPVKRTSEDSLTEHKTGTIRISSVKPALDELTEKKDQTEKTDALSLWLKRLSSKSSQ